MGSFSSTSFIGGFPKEAQTINTNTATGSKIQPITVQVRSAEALSAPLAGFGVSGSGVISYALDSAITEAETEIITVPPVTVNLTPDTGQVIAEGSILFYFDSRQVFFDRNGTMYRDMDPLTGAGIECGTVNYSTGECTVTPTYPGTDLTSLYIVSLVTEIAPQYIVEAHFRTPGAPIRPGSFYVAGTLANGQAFNATADFSGDITGDYVQGGIDVETGIVNLYFGCSTTAAGEEGEEYYDADNIRADGKLWVPMPVVADSVTYNCVVYSYLPLDADLIGIDPVRLPTDGRVPIISEGNVIVVHNTKTQTLSAPLAPGQAITLSRGNLSLVELYDSSGTFVPSAGNYTADLEAGEVTMETGMDISAFTEPLVAMHRVEDMRLVTDVQINGQISIASPISHDYEIDETYISSALTFGDLASKVVGVFDQKTWTGEWSDALIGDSCIANYNTVQYPITTTNKGAIAERWMFKFTSTTTIDVIGENVGVIAEDHPITNTLAPINPATGSPYFTIDKDGWGAGWATGNLLRLNTEAANHHLWVVRTTLSGPVTEANDQFTIQIRGDAD